MIVDKDLYERIKKRVKKKVKSWPSVYASSLLVSDYKKAGGRYSGNKSDTSGLRKWYRENWIDICHFPKVKLWQTYVASKIKCRPMYESQKIPQ